MKKRVDYACVTSDTAKKFGFYGKGCVTVSLVYEKSNRMPLVIAAFEKQIQALRFAEKLRLDYDSLTKRFVLKQS